MATPLFAICHLPFDIRPALFRGLLVVGDPDGATAARRTHDRSAAPDVARDLAFLDCSGDRKPSTTTDPELVVASSVRLPDPTASRMAPDVDDEVHGFVALPVTVVRPLSVLVVRLPLTPDNGSRSIRFRRRRRRGR